MTCSWCVIVHECSILVQYPGHLLVLDHTVQHTMDGNKANTKQPKLTEPLKRQAILQANKAAFEKARKEHPLAMLVDCTETSQFGNPFILGLPGVDLKFRPNDDDSVCDRGDGGQDTGNKKGQYKYN